MPTRPTLHLPKRVLMTQALQQMQHELAVAPPWSPQQKLALTCRILFDNGHDSALAGQITARADQPGTFYTQRLGLGFDEIRASNVLRVDEDLTCIDGAGMPNPANRFHTWIYRARPDVQCIIHTHAFHAASLAMLGQPLVVSHMDTCALYGDCGFLQAWPGVPVGNEEGQLMAHALGPNRAALLAHHGLLVACASIEEACVVALQFEKAARMQLAASAVGEVKALPEALAREAHDWLLSPKRIDTAFFYFARRALKRGADCLE